PEPAVDEAVVVPSAAADQEVAKVPAADALRRTKQRATDERQTEELVRPHERSPERDRREEDQAGDERRTLHRDVQGDPAAERVPEDDRSLDTNLIRDCEDHLGELREPRRLLAQGGSEAEAGEFDDVGGEAEVAQRAGLRCDRVRGFAHAREHERVWAARGTARSDTDSIATVFDDGVFHEPKMAHAYKANRPERVEVTRAYRIATRVGDESRDLDPTHRR